MHLFISLLGLTGVALARYPCGKVCIDSINECGVRYGGCFDRCTDPVPQPPPCSSVTTPSTTSTPSPLTPTPPPSVPGEDDDCATRTICIDAINDCGVTYGGCFPDCKPYPLVDPGCEITPVPLPRPTP